MTPKLNGYANKSHRYKLYKTNCKLANLIKKIGIVFYDNDRTIRTNLIMIYFIKIVASLRKRINEADNGVAVCT